MTDDTGTPRGVPEAIVRPDEAARSLVVSRRHPRESLRPFVEYLWIVHWTAPEVRDQQVLPQPKIQLAAEQGRLLVHGVSRAPFHRTLTGTGHVIGVAFRAGGFHPFLRSRVGALEGTVTPAGSLLGVDDAPAAAAALATTDDDTMTELVEDYLESCAPQPDPTVDEVDRLVTLIETDRSVHRVDQLADRTGHHIRTLQRLFTEYVGIGPKWVIQRHRLLDAAALVHAGTPVSWSELAHQLGFSDQAHLVRAFTAAVGTPPATYVRRLDGWRPRG